MTKPFSHSPIVRDLRTSFLPDPSGNAPELKSSRNPENVFRP